MKKIFVSFAFIVSFLVSIVLFLPYSKIYNNILLRLSKDSGVNVSYKISKASPTHLYLKNIGFMIFKKPMDINECRINFTPFEFLTKDKIARIIIKVDGRGGDFNVYKKGGKYLIMGTFPTALIVSFVDEKWAVFFKDFKGTDNLDIMLLPSKKRINIKKLKITGDFELTAKGYIHSGNLRLIGAVKIGKIKENFSF